MISGCKYGALQAPSQRGNIMFNEPNGKPASNIGELQLHLINKGMFLKREVTLTGYTPCVKMMLVPPLDPKAQPRSSPYCSHSPTTPLP